MTQEDRIETLLLEIRRDLRNYYKLSEQRLQVNHIVKGNVVQQIEEVHDTPHGLVIKIK